MGDEQIEDLVRAIWQRKWEECTEEERLFITDIHQTFTTTANEADGGEAVLTGRLRSVISTVSNSLSPPCIFLLALFIKAAIGNECPSAMLLLLIETFPECSKLQFETGEGVTLIHFACLNGSSLDVVRALYNANPDAIRIEEDNGALPLHYASYGGSSLGVIRLLVDAYPESVTMQCSTGKTPLHLACEDGSPLEVVEFLADAYPEAVMLKSHYDGRLPLHNACRSDYSSHAIVQFLIDRYQGAAADRGGLAITNNDGGLPIHDASFTSGATVETLQLLIRMHPSSINVATTRRNLLPLHCACMSGDDNEERLVEKVRILVEADPLSILQTDVFGITPKHAAYNSRRVSRLYQFLGEKETEAVARIRNDFDAGIQPLLSSLNGDTKEHIWKFIKPCLWQVSDLD